MATLRRSKVAVDSYSMLTYDSPPGRGGWREEGEHLSGGAGACSQRACLAPRPPPSKANHTHTLHYPHQPPSPDTEGQQLMVSGTSDSSFVVKRHLSTPKGAPVGKGRAGSFSASTFSVGG